MKHILITLIAACAISSVALAEESHSITESVKEHASEAKTEAKKAARSGKRTAKKAMHRAEEAVCMKGDLKCAAEKAGNRFEETKDATVDGMKNTRDDLND